MVQLDEIIRIATVHCSWSVRWNWLYDESLSACVQHFMSACMHVFEFPQCARFPSYHCLLQSSSLALLCSTCACERGDPFVLYFRIETLNGTSVTMRIRYVCMLLSLNTPKLRVSREQQHVQCTPTMHCIWFSIQREYWRSENGKIVAGAANSNQRERATGKKQSRNKMIYQTKLNRAEPSNPACNMHTEWNE